MSFGETMKSLCWHFWSIENRKIAWCLEHFSTGSRHTTQANTVRLMKRLYNISASQWSLIIDDDIHRNYWFSSIEYWITPHNHLQIPFPTMHIISNSFHHPEHSIKTHHIELQRYHFRSTSTYNQVCHTQSRQPYTITLSTTSTISKHNIQSLRYPGLHA